MIQQRIKEIENEAERLEFYVEMNIHIKYINKIQRNIIKHKVTESKKRIERIKEIKAGLITKLNYNFKK